MDDLRIVDPHASPLASWRRLTRQCAMPYLRSPHTHNLDLSIMSLRRFWAGHVRRTESDFIDPYLRPALDLFNRHCAHVIARCGLAGLWHRGTAQRVTAITGGLRVHLDGDYLDTRALVLAVGRNAHPHWPAWAQAVKAAGGAVDHIYDPGFDPSALPPSAETVVVGGGISAASLARRLAAGAGSRVTLISRHSLRTDNLDFDPCWAGPKCIGPFQAVPYARRRAIVDRERRRGTVTQEVAEGLAACTRTGRLRIVDDGAFTAGGIGGRACFDTAVGRIVADRVVLATGFDRGVPGGGFVSRLIRERSLPTAACGYPRLNRRLEWGRGIYAMGPLAELVIGPAAGNIIGGRHAARRITAAITGRVSSPSP